MVTKVHSGEMQTHANWYSWPNMDQKYTLKSTILERANDEKDIRVHIDHELSFDKHISEKVNKANSMFALLRRTFQYLDAESFIPLY